MAILITAPIERLKLFRHSENGWRN
ncbi:hypothetical protein E2C01_084609 [Portunus trituberculatus]|uniref:Uncharacterized protein n=1 Tax=Portunus trituberculatus TaxID=210409 RepID=A0A5B7J4G9_PORTR|nr:hypothetical protein [Portunus trituberculatus]